MASILEILFLISAILFPTVHAYYDDLCPTSTCGGLSMNYPFKLQSFQPQDNCSYIDLTCDSTNQTTLNLPYAGDFHVRYIAYYSTQQIQLHDPENCLMGRLMKNPNLSSSPFRAIAYENYTFYTCPSSADIIGTGVLFPIGCLSNSTNSTFATAFIKSEFMLLVGCESIGTWELPVLGPGQFESNGVNTDLYLTWDSATCADCQMSDDAGGIGKRHF